MRTPGAATLALVGTDRLSDSSRAALTAVVTNSSNRELSVSLRGDAGDHRLRFVDRCGPPQRPTAFSSWALVILERPLMPFWRASL